LPGFDVGECLPQAPELLALLAQADAEFVTRYPELNGQRRGPVLGDARFLVARSDGVAVGCVALQEGGEPAGAGCYELKRMFVVPQARGTGAADVLMRHAEMLAIRIGAQMLCLETGERQPEAARLVERHGYARIAPYPPYLDDPFARCYGKHVASIAHLPDTA
jgi:putative acetyltransferase